MGTNYHFERLLADEKNRFSLFEDKNGKEDPSLSWVVFLKFVLVNVMHSQRILLNKFIQIQKALSRFCESKWKRRHIILLILNLTMLFIIILMNSSVKAYSKLKWTPEEEQLLRVLKQQKHIESWKIIANEMNQIFLEKNRSGKQCRERYMNYVRFGNEAPKTSGWTQQEDEELFIKFMHHGAKWVQIGREMLGRSENCLKNRFYGAMRKIIRKINRASKEKKLRQKKPIKADLLIRILEHQLGPKQKMLNLNSETQQFLEGLKREMIKIAINPEQNSSSEQIQSLIAGIIKFCNLVKGPSSKKKFSEKELQDEPESQQQVVEAIGEDDQNQNLKISEQNQFDDAGSLKQNREVELRPKIVTNFILVSSLNLNLTNSQEKGEENSTTKRSDEILSSFRKNSSF